MTRTVHPLAVELIKRYEACPSKDGVCMPYQGRADAKGVLTIGWGHVIKPHEQHLLMGITKAEADALFLKDLAEHSQHIQADIGAGVALSDQVFGAFASFAFNNGPRIFAIKNSSIRDAARRGDLTGAIFNMYQYCKSGRPAVYVDGLFYRRAVEMYLALTGKLVDSIHDCRRVRFLMTAMEPYGKDKVPNMRNYFSARHRGCGACKKA